MTDTAPPSPEPARWDQPGPGTWVLDTTHNLTPLPRFMDVFNAAFGDGFGIGFRLIGAPLDRIEAATVNGWSYSTVRPLGGRPDGGGGPPPKWLMSVLFRVHPELRRRHATARRMIGERAWTTAISDWERTGRDATAALIEPLGDIELVHLSDDRLAAHVQRCADVLAETTRVHFTHAAIVALVSGQLIVLAERHGIAANDALSAVAGWSSAVRRPNELADRIVDALRADDALDVLAAEPANLYDMIRSSSEPAAVALRAYLREVGPVPAGGISVADPTMLERPEVVATALRRRVDGATTESDLRAQAEARARDLTDRIAEQHRAAFRRAVDDARRVAPVRDQTGALVMAAIGHSRLALLEVGRRLVERSWATAPDDAIDLLPSEVRPTLHAAAHLPPSGPDAVSADQLADRVTTRRRNASLQPPDTLGPIGEPPPLDIFPDAIAELSEAVFAFTQRFESTGDHAPTAGLGIGDRPVTGRAVLVRDLADLDHVDVGDVLVTSTTSPAYNAVLAIAGAVVTEVGGSISHAAIMARELGLTAIVGYPCAMQIPDGALVTVDPTTPSVTVAT